MNLKAFLVDALGTALDLGLGSPDDVLRHLTPDVLANQLPRPLWARLLTACLGAPKVDAQLVVDTLGVPNLVEHIATDLIWSVVSDIATKALGGVRAVAIPSAPSAAAGAAARSPFGGTGSAARTTTPAKGIPVTGSTAGSPTTPAKGVPLTPPPPAATPTPEAPSRPTPSGVLKTSIPSPAAAAASSSQSLANLDLGDDEPTSSPSRARTPTGQRFRQSQSGLSRMTAASAAARRPQAQAPAPQPAPAATPVAARTPIRRGATDLSDLETETSVGEKDWDQEINVDEDQLVDWQSSEETVTGNESTLANLPRKR